MGFDVGVFDDGGDVEAVVFAAMLDVFDVFLGYMSDGERDNCESTQLTVSVSWIDVLFSEDIAIVRVDETDRLQYQIRRRALQDESSTHLCYRRHKAYCPRQSKEEV